MVNVLFYLGFPGKEEQLAKDDVIKVQRARTDFEYLRENLTGFSRVRISVGFIGEPIVGLMLR